MVCGFITQESDEYMQSLAEEVGGLMREVLAASPFVTREAAALTAAMSYCDDAKKNGIKAAALQERVDELEVEAELRQEEQDALGQASLEQASPDPALEERLRQLEERNTALEESAGRAKDLEEKLSRLEDENAALRETLAKAGEPKAPPVKPESPPKQEPSKPAPRRGNPLRHQEEMEQEGFVSFFEKK